jgi:hypothetical protein
MVLSGWGTAPCAHYLEITIDGFPETCGQDEEIEIKKKEAAN